MSALDPGEAGTRVAGLYARSAPQLFEDLAESGAAPPEPVARAQSREEWEYFALFGCVRGLVATKGFGRRTVAAIDALHAGVFRDWDAAARDAAHADARRSMLAKRYNEYETIAQTGGASGASSAATRLGAAAAAHMLGVTDAPDDLAELLGSMHESLAEAVVALLSGEPAMNDSTSAPATTGHPALAPPSTGAEDVVPNGVTTPPLDGAWRIVARLERAGVECALGGSGLLAALGLADTVRDWDLTTDAPRAAVEAALAGLDSTHKGSDALHADEKFMIPELDLEIIRGFSFFTPAGVVRIPTIVTRRWAGLPVGSPECWAAAYHLLGRDAKRDALLDWLRGHGAGGAALDALLAQPLPAELTSLLRALPRHAG